MELYKLSNCSKRKMLCAGILLIGLNPSLALAAPIITNVNGTLSHRQLVTISGSEFGSKSTPHPIVWDDCSGTNVTAKWSGAWPEPVAQPNSTPRYTTPINGVATAHGNTTKYLAGRAYDGAGTGSGYPKNVMVWKNRTVTNYPVYSYISWYQRVDPSSSFGDNFKWFDYSTRNSPYTMSTSTDSNWYLEYVGGVGNSFHVNDDGGSITNVGPNWTLDYLGNSKYHGSSKNITTQWVKIELVIKYTNQNDGWYDIFEDGVLKKNGSHPHSYNGPTDKYTSTTLRNEAIGGFSRLGGENNWRYFNDIYLDYTQARVMLGNAPTLAACTIREPQPATQWSIGTITINVNAGKLTTGQKAYLYVIDSNGTVNSNGYEVTIGNSVSAPVTPVAPILNSIQIK